MKMENYQDCVSFVLLMKYHLHTYIDTLLHFRIDGEKVEANEYPDPLIFLILTMRDIENNAGSEFARPSFFHL